MIRDLKRKGFSLIELLIAIFILGIGIISIAALFPAGIAQQQKSTDDLIGSIVARNALTIIRSKLNQEDFGDPRDFVGNGWSLNVCGINLGGVNINPYQTICGDWMWRRPAIITDTVDDEDLIGAIDIFASSASELPVLTELWPTDSNPPLPDPLPGLPYSKGRYPDFLVDGIPDKLNVPIIRILAGERQYPMWEGEAQFWPATGPLSRPKAKYYWDCMFRRYQGRIIVAIFVYRVVDPESEGAYTVDTDGMQFPNQPYHVDLTSISTGSWPGPEDEEGVILANTQNDNPEDADYQWQYPGQWLVDQNGIIHRVQRGRRRSNDQEVRLSARPAGVPVFSSLANPHQPGVNANWWDKGNVTLPDVQNNGYGIVTDIWYMPTKDSKERSIIPVYATVEDL